MNRRSFLRTASAGLALSQGRSVQGAAAEQGASGELKWLEVHSGIWKARLGSPEACTPVSSRLIPPKTDQLKLLPAIENPPVQTISGRLTKRGCLLELPLAAYEELYGFGLQLLSFAQRGKKRTIRVNADPKLDTGDSHAPVPFYVSTRGYGILVDSCRHVDFYCGDARPVPAQADRDAADDKVNTPDSTRNLPLDQQGRVTVEVPRAGGVDVYLFAGPAMVDVVKRYNLFSGGGVEPPKWGLGFWYRAEGQSDQAAVLRLAREFRDRRIPCDVFGLEPGWQTHAYSCSFVWDQKRFPEPRELVKQATELGLKINLWEHAFTHPSSPLFGPLRPHAGDYGVWGGLVPDFAGQPARQIFGDYHGRELIDLGIAGFKLDECDSSDYTRGWSFPDFSSFPSAIDGEQMHAVFGLRYQHTILSQYEKRQKQTFGLVRSSGALAAPYPFVLYSDLYGHRDFVRALVNAGFSGLLWCPEVRDAVSEEDLIRRLETVVFSPLAMVNAWSIKNPPWKQLNRDKNNADELGANWHALEDRCRAIIGWRMQLIPYLQSAFAQYARDGTPPFRPLLLDYPHDDSLRNVDDAYMVGDRMLVAPMFAGESGRRLSLPEGKWHEFWSGAATEGGRTIDISTATERIPVYVKSGSVFPLAGVTDSTDSVEARDWTVQVYGDGSLPWRLNQGSGPMLHWDMKAMRGISELNGPEYNVVGWKHMG
jgi:alpha-D-xyloside xylohydrolase